MPLLSLRYDLRCAPFDATTSAELVATALDQCEWADRLGFAAVTLSEHHGSPDGYLPSPLVFGAAVAARTRNLRIVIAALIAPLHDPIRLAEDIAVLDVVSNGRVIPVVSGGYVESEFRAFGKRLSDRAQRDGGDRPVPRARLERRAVRAPRRHGAGDAAPGAAAAPADLHGRRARRPRRAAPRATPITSFRRCPSSSTSTARSA